MLLLVFNFFFFLTKHYPTIRGSLSRAGLSQNLVCYNLLLGAAPAAEHKPAWPGRGLWDSLQLQRPLDSPASRVSSLVCWLWDWTSLWKESPVDVQPRFTLSLNYHSLSVFLTRKRLQGLKQTTVLWKGELALGFRCLLFPGHSQCLLKHTLVAKMFRDAETRRGENGSGLQSQLPRRWPLLQPGLPVSPHKAGGWMASAPPGFET